MSNIYIIPLAVTAAMRGHRAILDVQTDTPGMSKTAPTAPGVGTPAASELSEGEIRKVDKDNKKLTIKHGPLKNLDMPGMTMVFGVDAPCGARHARGRGQGQVSGREGGRQDHRDKDRGGPLKAREAGGRPPDRRGRPHCNEGTHVGFLTNR